MKLFQNLIISIVIQLSAYFTVSVINILYANSLLALIGGLAVILLISFLLKLERRWVLCNLAIPLAIFVGTHPSNLNTVLLAIAPIFILLYLPTIWSRVPYYPTHKKTYVVIEKLLDNSKDFTFLDAGCGDGKLLCYLAKKYPSAKFIGLEISPLSFLIAFFNSKLSGLSNISIKLSSFWNYNFADFDYVYAFLAPQPMPKIKEKALNEMKKGQTLIVNSFPIEHKASEIIKIEDYQADRSGTIYVYKF